MKKRITGIIIILAAMAAFTLAATSCTQPLAQPDIAYRDIEQGGKVPQVSGFIGSDNINQKLLDVFTPYAEKAYAACAEADDELNVEYSLTKQKSTNPFSPEYLVEMKIFDRSGNSFTVTSVTLSGLSKLYAQEVSPSDLKWLGSGDAVSSSLKLKGMGIDVTPAYVYSSANEKFAHELFVDLYEKEVGRPVDISNVKICASCGELYQKSLVLELIGYYHEYDEPYEYTDYYSYINQLYDTQNLLKHIMNDRCGIHNDKITGDDLIDIIKLYIDVLGLSAEDITAWKEFGDIDMSAVAKEAEMSEKDITRADAAELIWKINKKAPTFGVKFNDKNLVGKDVCSNIWARRVLSYDFMKYYGDSTVFAADQAMSYVNALDNALRFVNQKFNSMAYSDEYINYFIDDSKSSKRKIVDQLEMMMNYFENWQQKHGIEEFEVKEVINDREYDWYYNQNDTGAYSSVNCMPSIATMAAHWYNKNSKATVQKMRNTSDVTDGWTVYELRNGLHSFNIPYTSADANLGSITSALDEGKIVLAQYSDRPLEYSGHCYVIYGYRKYRNTTIFIVNDSDPLTERELLYGRPAGCGMELDADFSMWSIERFVSDVTVIG